MSGWRRFLGSDKEKNLGTRAHTVPKFYLHGFVAPETEGSRDPFVWIGSLKLWLSRTQQSKPSLRRSRARPQ
jgi:hypothetical protein